MENEVTSIPFRAPELLLGSNDYGKPIDIWAVGCIFAEVMEGKSLFGSKDGSDTDIILLEIFSKLGTPRQQSWLCSLSNFPNDVHQYPEASEILPNLDAVGNDLIKKMLAVDPLERITAGDALKHPYFK
ncbi:cell division control protein 2 homolog A-like isoform X2 [Apium graveolens]